ncbi:unnamed protein product [Pocillopora meandrina]|uniref:TNFR-Cys domain-containing protein n=1 Tax=Pocillopora meandrina TaxID=46732 RepID=A0AAU9W2X2_9CNID|nr:unnamed protein product [Pocillopora meandrina]
MLGLCKPCSPCCYDGKDIIIPECQVPGVPTGLQCSYLRSNKCSTLMTSSISTAPSTPQLDQSTTQWRPFSSTTGTEIISLSSEPTTNMVEENSPNVGSIVGPVVSSFTAFVTILVIVCCKNMRKRRSHQCCHQGNHCHDDQGQRCKVTTKNCSSRFCTHETQNGEILSSSKNSNAFLASPLKTMNVSVQANSSCQPDQITIKDPKTGSIQCQDCLKCPPGKGLSVNCGDVITPSTPVQCKPCVLGETYSASFKAGGCEDCGNK